MFAVTASAALIVRNARAAGTLAALFGFLAVALPAQPPDGALDALVVILPALEVTLFAFVVAFALDGVPVVGALAAVRIFALWAASVFVVIWLLVAATRSGIDAYVRLGGPPMMGFSF